MRFLDPRMPKRLLPRLRRLFARAALEKEEVNILRGILARIDQLLARQDGYWSTLPIPSLLNIPPFLPNFYFLISQH